MYVEDRRMREKGVSLAQSRLMKVIQHTPRAAGLISQPPLAIGPLGQRRDRL